MMFKLCVLCVVIITNFVSCCLYDDILVTVQLRNTTKTKQITRTLNDLVGDEDITYLYANKETISILCDGAFRSLQNLEQLVLYNCNIRLIEPGSIENVPKLKKLNLGSNRLSIIQKGVFNGLNIETLDLSDNNLLVLSKEALSNLPYLRILILKRNKIQEYDPTWFTNTTEIEELDLTFNNIETLPNRAFDKFNKINSILLGHNQLKNIDAGAFTGLPYLDKLDLSHNHLTTLPENVFEPFNGKTKIIKKTKKKRPSFPDFSIHFRENGIKNLHLHHNNLSYLQNQLLADITKNIKNINIHSNPWNCACYNRITDWAFKNDVDVDFKDTGCMDRRNPICVVSVHRRRQCVEEVNLQMHEIFYKSFTLPNGYRGFNVVCW